MIANGRNRFRTLISLKACEIVTRPSRRHGGFAISFATCHKAVRILTFKYVRHSVLRFTAGEFYGNRNVFADPEASPRSNPDPVCARCPGLASTDYSLAGTDPPVR